MRITTAGIARADAGFELTFEGRRVRAHAGESLAAALIAGGHWQFRDSNSGCARGMFCGMGVCGECQVLVDGQSRRACMEPARADVAVTRHPARAHVSAAAPAAAANNWEKLDTQVLIVGAGPAGLATARVAARQGLEVLVIDERRKPGGQFFKQPGEGFAIDESRLDVQYREGRDLYAQAVAAGARFMFGATAWGGFGADAIAVAAQGRTWLVNAKRVVLALGAYERAVAIPGWTLPGYITTGAAQTLLRGSQVSPGQRVLVAGNGPLNLQVANELMAAGATVVAIAELAASPLASPLAALGMLLSAPQLLAQGVAHLLRLRSRGVAVRYRHALIAVEGAGRVQRAVLARLDRANAPIARTRTVLEVDAVCVNHGFVPQSELARALGCEFRFEAATQAWTAERDEDGRSNVEHVFLAGDAGGLQGARCAIAQGALSAAAIAAELAAEPVPRRDVRQWQRELRRHRRFQRCLWRSFQAPTLSTELADAATYICRCEEIARDAVEAALGEHAPSFSVIKRATRAGMGRCQGRYCSSMLAALMRERFGSAPAADAFFAPRAPFKPVPAVELAGEWGAETEAVDILRTDGRNANIAP